MLKRLKIGDVIKQQVKCSKYFGVFIDGKLTWHLAVPHWLRLQSNYKICRRFMGDEGSWIL